MSGPQRYEQMCPLATALDIVGSRWALLTVRELMLGPRRFSELENGLESASTDMLTNRLRELEAAGVLTRGDDRRYSLTESGYSLAPTFSAMRKWVLAEGHTLGEGSGKEFDGVRRLMLNLAVAGRITTTPDDAKQANEHHVLTSGHVRVSAAAEHGQWVLTEIGKSQPATSQVAGEAQFLDDGLLAMVIGNSGPDELIEQQRLTVSTARTRDLLRDLAASLAVK